MSSRLHLGVNKFLLGDTVEDSGPGRQSGVFVEITSASPQAAKIQRLIPIGPSGRTVSIDVPSGRLAVQVRLPSGEVIDQDVIIPEGKDEILILQPKRSSHEWMSWPGLLKVDEIDTVDTEAVIDFRPEHDRVGLEPSSEPTYRRISFPPHSLPSADLWVRQSGGEIIVTGANQWTAEIDRERGLVSYTYAGPAPQRGDRPFLALTVHFRPSTLLATIPLPWSSRGQTPRVQVILNQESSTALEGFDVDVLVHDPWLAPMLGYFESGDLAAARHFESSVLENAEDLLGEKEANPIAAAAGAYLLLRTRALHRLHDWPRNLAARFEWLPDGPIIEATQMLRSSERNKEAIRQALVTGATRGVPVFAEGVRLLGDGMRMLATYEAKGSDPEGQYRRSRADDRFESVAEWVAALESATRPDTLFTILDAEDSLLRTLVDGFSH